MNLTIVKSAERHPLCVDLDGTLVNTDTLVEAVLCLLKENVLFAFLLPLWLSQGRKKFKLQVFRHANLKAKDLPFNQNVINTINKERALGRPIVLVTASPYIIAEKIGEYLDCFTEVLSSDELSNLKGKHKSNLLVQKFGDKGYDYIGNSSADIPVWKTASRAILVNCSKSTVKKTQKIAQSMEIIQVRKPLFKLIVKQIRVHQWTKNLLIFCPIVLSNQLTNWMAWLHGFHAFVAFSCLSSSVYIVNDILDLKADRLHKENSTRPFASGDLPLTWCGILFPLLFVAGILLSWSLSLEFLAIVLSYFGLTSAYSFRLKEVPIADILILASLYSWRVFAGSISTGIVFSEWFLTFAIFFFLSLALVKRCSELISMKNTARERNIRRGYFVDDLPLLVPLGVASAYMSILVLALYFNTPEVHMLNKHPKLLWIILPFLLFWISRVWMIAWRGKMPSDPLLFAMKDRLSYVIFAVIAGIWLLAKSW